VAGTKYQAFRRNAGLQSLQTVLQFVSFAVPSVFVLQKHRYKVPKLFEFLRNLATTWQVQSTKCFTSETLVVLYSGIASGLLCLWLFRSAFPQSGGGGVEEPENKQNPGASGVSGYIKVF
jgi:hypothetical protein